jgi:hypothetical protein
MDPLGRLRSATPIAVAQIHMARRNEGGMRQSFVGNTIFMMMLNIHKKLTSYATLLYNIIRILLSRGEPQKICFPSRKEFFS